MTIGVAAGLTVAVCSLVAWSVMRPHNHRRDDVGKPATSASANVPGAPITREALAAELALLPGLDGRWWFDDMPWLTPFVRQAIADKVLTSTDLTAVLGDRPQGYLSTNTTKARQWLWDAATRCRGNLSLRQQNLLDQLKAISDNRSGATITSTQPLEDALKQFVDGHTGNWSAADLHTVAVLQQAIARGATNDQDAKKQFEHALSAYAAESRRPGSTYALCELDAAVCSESLPLGTDDAKQRIDDLLGTNNLPVLFHVYLLVERGRLAAAIATPGDYEVHRFDYAQKLLDGYRSNRPAHPLAAYIAENYAASLLDQWKVAEAGKQLQAAYRIRLTNKDENEPLTTLYIFQDRRASVRVARYRGDLDARGIGKGLVVELNTAIDEAERGRRAGRKSLDVRVLDEQLAAALETLADCELYGGAAGAGRVNLALAADNYDQARKHTEVIDDIIVLSCKRAIVCALNGKRNDAEDEMTAVQRKLEQSHPGVAIGPRAGLAKQLAEAVLSVTGAAPADGRKLLRAFLDQFKLNPAARDSSRQEIVEMQLFAAELLLNSDFDSEPKSARRDLKHLDALLAIFHSRPEIRPYLRRYYELAVAAYDKADPSKIDLVQVARYLLDSRMAEPKPGTKATLVLFSFTPKENFTLFQPQDGRLGKRFDLKITRDDIKAAKGKPLHLNDDLVGLIKREVAEGRAVEVFWNDTASHPSQDPDALTDGDWPFDGQLDLKKLRETVVPSARKDSR